MVKRIGSRFKSSKTHSPRSKSKRTSEEFTDLSSPNAVIVCQVVKSDKPPPVPLRMEMRCDGFETVRTKKKTIKKSMKKIDKAKEQIISQMKDNDMSRHAYKDTHHDETREESKGVDIYRVIHSELVESEKQHGVSGDTYVMTQDEVRDERQAKFSKLRNEYLTLKESTPTLGKIAENHKTVPTERDVIYELEDARAQTKVPIVPHTIEWKVEAAQLTSSSYQVKGGKERQRQEGTEQKRLSEEEQKKQKKKAREEEVRKKRIEKELKRIIHDFSILCQKTTSSIAELREERKKLLAKRVSAEREERLAEEQIAQALSKQSDAAENEDFCLADRLAAVIDQHKKEQQEQHLILQEINGLINSLDTKQHKQSQKLLTHFKEVQHQLREFQDRQEHSDKRLSSKLTRESESESKRLAIESERLASVLKNIERDESIVEEKRTSLQAVLIEKTQDIEVMSVAASAKLKDINSEIKELRKQLAEKEMEAAEVKVELRSYGESTNNIKSSLALQFAGLAKEEETFKESRREWEIEYHAHEEAKREHEAEVAAAELRLERDKLLSEIKAEVSTAEQLTTVIANDLVNNGTNNDEASNAELDIAQDDLLTCEAAVAEANEILISARSYIDGLQKEIQSVDDRLPALEAKKKQAVSKRDFKAAGKASKEYKEMIARKEAYEEELQSRAIDRQASAQRELDKCVETLNKKKNILREEEHEGGRKRMVSLAKKIMKFKQLRKEVCVSNKLDEIDSESIVAVGRFVLDFEIAALVAEGEDLDSRFGGWKDILIQYTDNDDNMNTTLEEKKEIENVVGEKVKDEEEEEEEDCKDTDSSKVAMEGDKYTRDSHGSSNYENSHQSKEEKVLKRGKEIMLEIEALEAEIESAIKEEDFDDAADLVEKIESLKREHKKLGISAFDSTIDEGENEESTEVTKISNPLVSNNVEGNDHGTVNIDVKTEIKQQNNSTLSLQPSLYGDCREMMEYSILMFFLSKIRNLARSDKITGKPRENVLKRSVRISDIYSTVLSCYDVINEDDPKTDLHIEIMRTMMDRGGDDAYEVAVFDDSKQDKESVFAIIIDHYRRELVVGFRGTMVGNKHDMRSNLSMFQAWVSNPLLKMKRDKNTMRRAGQKQHLLVNQPKMLLMQSGWYTAIMHDKYKAGAGSKYDYIMKNVYHLLRKHPKYKLTVTGTSLGGVLAQVFAFHAATETNPLLEKPVKCYSFASPKVGTLRYREAVETLEELGHYQLLRVMTEGDPIRFVPREPTTMGCFTGVTTLSLICNQGLFYRTAGIELHISDSKIDLTHPKVPERSVKWNLFHFNLFCHDFQAQCDRQGMCCGLGWDLITCQCDEVEDEISREAHGYPMYYNLLEKNKAQLVKLDLDKIFKDSRDEKYALVSPIYS